MADNSRLLPMMTRVDRKQMCPESVTVLFCIMQNEKGAWARINGFPGAKMQRASASVKNSGSGFNWREMNAVRFAISVAENSPRGQ